MGTCCLSSERKPPAGSYVNYMSKFDEEHRQVAERKAIDQDVRTVYTLGKKLGEGSFGAVYLATDREGNQFACKRTKIRCLDDWREIAVLQTCKHQNLANMIELYYWKENPDNTEEKPENPDTTEEKPVVHMIMELFDGSLRNHVEKHQRVSEDTAKLVIRQILDALIYLQGKNIIHRDVTPKNIMVQCQEDAIKRVALCDLGWVNIRPQAAKDIDTTEGKLTVGGNVRIPRFATANAGTPLWCAPETVGTLDKSEYQVAEYSAQCDVFSLGLIGYWIVSGLDISGSWGHNYLMKVKNGPRPLEGWSDTTVSSGFRGVIEEMVCTLPNERSTAKQLIDKL